MYSSTTIPLIIWLLSSTSIVVNGDDCTLKKIVKSNTKGPKEKSCGTLSFECENAEIKAKEKPKKALFACTEYFLSNCLDNTNKKNAIKLLMLQLATEAVPTEAPPTEFPSSFPTEAPSDACAILCEDEDDTVEPIPARSDMQNIVNSYISGDNSDKGARAKYGSNINCWDTSHVKSFREAFQGQTSFNEPLDCWDVSSARNVYGMFADASTFNQDLSTWDVKRVTTFGEMFAQASSFNQDIGGWDVSKATAFMEMFNGAGAFNQNLCDWKYKNLTTYMGMFEGSGCFTVDEPSNSTACQDCTRRLGSSNNNNNNNSDNDNNNNHNNKHILQEDGLVLGAGAGAGMDDDITVFAPFEMVDDNIHQATDNDN